jgi:hypothetical protein
MANSPTFRDRYQMTVSGTPGTGTITLGSATSGYKAFVSGDNALYFDILITDGTAWEIDTLSVYTNSGTTLTRGTLVSSSTGSALSLTSAAIVSVIQRAASMIPATVDFTNFNFALGQGASVTSYAAQGHNIAIGQNANAGSTNIGDYGFAISIGYESNAYNSGIAIGTNSIANVIDSIAIGINSTTSTTGAWSVALGYGAIASGQQSIAIGGGAMATGLFQTVVGINNDQYGTGNTYTISGNYAIVIGSMSYTYANSAIGIVNIGSNAQSTGNYGISLGYYATTSSYTYSISIGYYATCGAASAISIGGNATYQSVANGANSIAIGNGTASATTAGAADAIAIGSNATTSSSIAAVAIGKNSIGYGVAIGNAAQSWNTGAVAIGPSSYAGSSCNALGRSASAGYTSTYNLALGDSATAGLSSNQNYGVALGANSQQTLYGQIAFGQKAQIGTNTYRSIVSLVKQTTNATPANLLLDNSSLLIVLPNSSISYFEAQIVAKVTGAADSGVWKIEGAIQRGASAAATAFVGTPTVTLIGLTSGAVSGSWAITSNADTTNGSLNLQATGQASTTIDWYATINLTQLVY